MEEEQIAAVQELLVSRVKLGMTPAQAEADLHRFGFLPTEGINQASARYARQLELIRGLTQTRATVAATHFDWYPGPSTNDVLWPMLAASQQSRPMGISPRTPWAAVDEASTLVVSLLASPTGPCLRSRGRLLGDPQDDAMAVIPAVMAKAADAGYRLFIVLVPPDGDQQRRIQARLERELVDLDRSRWRCFSEAGTAFTAAGALALEPCLTTEVHRRLLCVVEKDGSAMKAVAHWLRQAHTDLLVDWPALVIDGDADIDAVPAPINWALEALLQALPRFARLDLSVRTAGAPSAPMGEGAKSLADSVAVRGGGWLHRAALDFLVDPLWPSDVVGA